MVAQKLEPESGEKCDLVSPRTAPRARDFNWHNTIGFWYAAPLFLIVISAVVISYTWAGNLVYRIVGETPPAPRANQPVQPHGNER